MITVNGGNVWSLNLNEPTNQISIKVLKIAKPTNKKALL